VRDSVQEGFAVTALSGQVTGRTGSLPRVELIEKTLAGPRSAIERGRSNPRLAIAVIVGALLLIAWVAWAIYVSRDNGANAGLGVVLSWPVLLAALALIASPFVGLYLLVRRLSGEESSEGSERQPGDEETAEDVVVDEADPEDDGSEGEDDEDPEEDEESEEDDPEEDEKPEDEDPEEEGSEDDDPEDDDEEPEETDADEEPSSGERRPPPPATASSA
jgi:hypothetical protein